MCVTNIAKRRPERTAMAPHVAASTPSLISQRLLDNFLPLMQNASACGGPSTISTSNFRCAPQHKQMGQVPQAAHAALPQTVSVPMEEKPRPKRRRKPQKPGKTAKQNDRHFVVHDYHDHACDADENDVELQDSRQRRRGGVAVSFPLKLHDVLEQVEKDGLGHVISWQSHGRCFVIHKPKEFVDHVMPSYFRQTKLTSFQRQLNLYGFCRLTRGRDSGGYYHELFLRGKPFLCKRMVRTKVKGTKFKAASSPENEPDFYSMAPIQATPPTTDESSSDEANTPGEICRRLPPEPGDGPLFNDGLLACVNLEATSGLSPHNASVQQLAGFPSTYRTPVKPSSAVAIKRQPGCSAPGPRSSIEVNPMSPVASDPSNQPLMPNPMFVMQSSAMNRLVADRILDEAVDELFRDDQMLQDASSLDFANVWDSSSFGVDDAVRDDTELGFLLERLLED